jgi:UDP-N-acetylglucosamine transferase subunit ALG13
VSVSAPLVLVVVGTDKHPFDRLVGWMDEWLSSRDDGPLRCLVQHGTSRAPRVAEGRPFVDHEELEQLMAASAVVVTHGGPTTISEARRLGHRPIVVPRRPEAGEHVDGHQVRFAQRLSAAGLVTLVDDAAGLRAAVQACLAQASGVVQPRVPEEDGTVQAAYAFARVVDDVLRAGTRPRRGT